MSSNNSNQNQESEHQANPAILPNPSDSSMHIDRQLPQIVVNPEVAAPVNLDCYALKKDGPAEERTPIKEEFEDNTLKPIVNVTWPQERPTIHEFRNTETG